MDYPTIQSIHRTFLAHNPNYVWRVDKGGVDLFLQQRGIAGEPEGARHHLFRSLPGQLFFGANASALPGGQSLIAVPLPDTTLCVTTVDGLATVLPLAELERLCEEWVITTTDAMQLPPAPRDSILIVADQPQQFDKDKTVRTARPVAWIEVITGQALWMERHDSVVNAALGPLPLPRDLWMKSTSRLVTQMVRITDLLRDGRLWSALTRHLHFVLMWFIVATEYARSHERSRLEMRADQSIIIRHEALRQLIGIAPQPAAAILRPNKHDVCLIACRTIGTQMGIEFRLPHASEFATMDRFPVAAIATASGVRYRRVVLKGSWWNGDNGPLLARYSDSDNWVALLPRFNGYDAFDPITNQTQPVTEKFAASLKPLATMFYRVLPDNLLNFGDIFSFITHGRKNDFILVLILGALGGLLGLATPIATGMLFDTLIPSADIDAIVQMVTALIAVAVAATLFEISRAIAVLRMEGKMDSALQAALWDRVLRLPAGFFRRYSVGDLSLRINGVNNIRQSLSRTTVGTLLTALFSMFSYLLLFHYSITLAGVATLMVVVAVLITLGIGYLKLRYERALAHASGQIQSLVFQYLSGIVKLRVSSTESRAFANWAGHFAHYRGLQFRAQHWANIEQTLLTGYSTVALAVLFATMGTLIAEGAHIHFNTGEFIAFNVAFSTFFSGMVSLAETLLGMLNLVPLYERAKPILEMVTETNIHKPHPGELQGNIELSKVSFCYQENVYVLKNISFSIRPGGFVALVGSSGSGKSTLLRLLLGFETPASGSIYYDHQDLVKLDVQAVRRQLGVVLQSSQLIAGDIYTNIIGTTGLTIEDAWEAARMVGLDEEINQMPMGMHTIITDGTSILSGGQRQRILIARAIIHRPRILFFDEATSALDNRTQAIITHSLNGLKSTRIVIAHRLSTIINADSIIVIEKGEIAQIGTFQSLIDQPGPFAKMAKRQIA
ncbi:NHLP bacteriocin export ABC transporter permease/ATPase subunit [Gammaproteobacteria bacterium]